MQLLGINTKSETNVKTDVLFFEPFFKAFSFLILKDKFCDILG